MNKEVNAGLLSSAFPFVFPYKFVYAFLVSPVRAAGIDLILLVLMVPMKYSRTST
jgi:hypothetical protein